MASTTYKPAPPSAIAVDVHGAPTTHDANGIRLGAWSAEICGCFTDLVPNCCMAWCLPFISVAQIAHRIRVARYSVVLISFLVLYVLAIVLAAIAMAAMVNSTMETTQSVFNSIYNDDSYGSVEISVSSTGLALGSVSQIIFAGVALVYFLLVWQLRSKVRERFQIPGSCCGDYCCVWWCSCCTIAQMATHVKSYTPGSCDFGPPDELPAYE